MFSIRAILVGVFVAMHTSFLILKSYRRYVIIVKKRGHLMKLNVKEILSGGVEVIRNHYNKLLPFILFVFICNLFTSIYGLTPSFMQSKPLINSLAVLLSSIIVIAATIFVIKLTLAIQVSINAVLSEQEMSWTTAYMKVKGKFWLYIRYAILVGLFFIPIIVLIILKVPYTTVINTLYGNFILALFCMMAPLVALEEKANKYLRRSINMIKGNYWRVWVILFFSSTIFMLPSVISISLFPGQSYEIAIISIVNAFIGIFTLPFLNAVIVLTYRKLKAEVVRIDEFDTIN